MLATRRTEPASSPPDDFDQRVVLHGVGWEGYEALLEIRGDRAGARLYFLEGDVEIMSPSDGHEWLKKTLARLLEAYAEERGIEFNGYGSLTMRKRPRARGAEPDECYIIGRPRLRAGEPPDLAVEVIWTPGGLDKLAIYSGLGVKELWLCRVQKNDVVLSVLTLRRGRYVEAGQSRMLPGLDLGVLARYLRADSQSRAVKAFRASLRRST